MTAIAKAFPVSAVAALMLAVAAPCAHAASVLVNGDFEAGDLSGWSTSGPLDFVGADPFAAHSGTYGAFFGPETTVTLSQTPNTTTGATYLVSFWLSLQDSAQPNSFSWSWNGVTQAPSFGDAAGFDYTEFTALVNGGPGSSSSIAFSFDDPQSFWLLDDVTVTPIPEPGVAWAAGLGAWWLARRARRPSEAGRPARVR